MQHSGFSTQIDSNVHFDGIMTRFPTQNHCLLRLSMSLSTISCHFRHGRESATFLTHRKFCSPKDDFGVD